MRAASLILILICSVFHFDRTCAQTPADVFNNGNELYRSGKYQDAAKEYERIIKQGFVSSEIYFNLGNAYYRNEQLGRAIISFERASVLHPNDPDIEHDLKLAYLKTVDRIEPVPDLFFIQWMRAAGNLMTPETVRICFIISWVLFFGSLVVMYLVMIPGILQIARVSFFCSFVLVILFALMLGVQSFRDTSHNKAVITAQVVTVKSSPDAKSVDAFVIHEGLKVKLTDAVGDWVKVTLVDGKVGWITSDQCERI